MVEKNEIVIVALEFHDRIRLDNQITSQARKLGLDPSDYNNLNLGFKLPNGWPVNIEIQPTLAELVVIAKKLKMRIVINGIDLIVFTDEKTFGG